jgi:hypothetical protein
LLPYNLDFTASQGILKWAERIKKSNIEIHIQWVPGHTGILGNEKADQAARYGAEMPTGRNPPLSITHIKRHLKAKCPEEWETTWSTTRKSRHYQQFKTKAAWKPENLKLPKLLWSTLMQLKLGHGYFRSL